MKNSINEADLIQYRKTMAHEALKDAQILSENDLQNPFPLDSLNSVWSE